jgi:hypothetical protein
MARLVVHFPQNPFGNAALSDVPEVFHCGFEKLRKLLNAWSPP